MASESNGALGLFSTFFEVFMDLFWLAPIMSFGVTNTCEQLNPWIEAQDEIQLYSQR